MVYAPVRQIIPSLKLGDYLSVQAHKPCSISHFKERKPQKLQLYSFNIIINGNRSFSRSHTVKKIRRFYGTIPGIWLPVLLPLFLRAFTCRTFLEIRTVLENRIVGLYDKNNNVLCYRSVPDSGACKKQQEKDWQLVASYFTVKSTDFFTVQLTL